MKSKLEVVLGASIASGSQKALDGLHSIFARLSADAGNLAKKMTKLGKVSAKKPFDEGAKASKEFAKGMDAASKSADTLSRKTDKAAVSAKRLADITKNMSKIAPAAVGMIAAPPVIKGLPPNIAREYDKIAKASVGAQKGLRAVGDESKKTYTLLDHLKNGVSAVVAKFKSFVAYAVGAGIFAGIVLSVMSAQQAIFDYDQALHDLKAITQATDEETARMGETIKQVAATTKFSTAEVADGMKTLGQAGFTAEEAIRGIQGIADLATGTLTNMSDSVDLVSTAIRAFGMDASEATEVSDVFANAINGSKLTMDKLRVAFNYIGPIAKLAGVEFKDLTSTMMMLANKGIRASTIGTGLRQVLNKILKPTEAFTQAVANAGLTMDDLNPKTNSMREIIGRLSLVVTDADDAFKMFGMRGAAAVSALVEGGAPQFDEMRSLVDRTGMAAKMAGEQLKGLTLRLKQLTDKFSVFFAELRDQGLGEPLGWIIDSGRYAMDVMILLAKNGLAPVVKWLGLLAVALASVKLVLFAKSMEGSLWIFTKYFNATVAVTGATNAFTASLVKAWVATKAFFAGLGPIGWILMALGIAASAAAVSLRKYSDGLKETIATSESVISAMDRLDIAINKTKVNLIGIREGSDEYKSALVKLKDEIEATAKEFPQIKKEADLVIASMDTLNGKFTDGQKALRSFGDSLSDIKFAAATDRIKAFDSALEGSLFWQFITGKAKDIGKGVMRHIWDSTLGAYFGLADKAFDAFSDKYSGLVDFIGKKALGMGGSTFEAMEKASKDGGKALEDWNNLLAVGKEYIQDWSKETGIALDKLSPEALEELSFELQEALDVSDRMRKSMVRGAKEIAEAFRKQGVGHQINQWNKEFVEFGDSVIGLKYKLTQQGDIFAPIGKALGSIMEEADWSRLFDMETQKVKLAVDLKELEKGYADHVISHEEYARRKYSIGKRFNEAERQLKTDEKYQTLKQFADLARARDTELEKLKIHAKHYSKEQQEMMRLEIDDKYLTKSVDLLYKLDEKRKKAAGKYEKTEADLKETLADSWEDYYEDMAKMASELSDKRKDLAEDHAEKVLQINVDLNRKLRDLKSDSLKAELKSALSSRDIYEDISNAKKAIASGNIKEALAYAKSAQAGLSSLTSTSKAKKYAAEISKIYKEAGKSTHEYQVSLQNDVRDVRNKEMLASKLDLKARREMERDLSNARRALKKGDAESAAKYAKAAEASLGDVKDIRAMLSYVAQVRGIMQKAEKALYKEKQGALTAEYNEKRKARKIDMDEELADNQELMAAAKKKFDAEANFLDQTMLLQKRNTAESLKGTKAQIDMYNAAKKTAAMIAKTGSVVVQGKADGGPIFPRLTDPHITKGSGSRDDVPAMLKKDEFVFRPEAVRAFGVPFLRDMNDRLTMMRNVVVKQFSGGGFVTAGSGASGGSESFVNVSLNLPVPGRAIQTKMSGMNATEFIRQLKGLEKLSS